MLRFFVFLLWVSPCVLTKATGSCQGTDCLQKTWHNVSCRTKDDCNAHHTTCYQRVCRCHPGYFYTTHYTCTDTCSPGELQETFTQYPDSALRANLIHSEDGLTVEVCKSRCQANKTCLTFDFKASGGQCRLHNVTAHQSPSQWSPKRSRGWTHYQKSCNSTFASHDNWYNLLCESKIDCTDINSDCLSGRCLCRSGFMFNQAKKECVFASELKKWHNTSCTTDDDCDQPYTTCYKRVCRCEAGYFYTTQDTCTSTCSPDDLQDSFTDYPDSALRANLIGSQDGLTVEACKSRCQTNKTCLTFDFKASGGLCRLHDVTAHESPSYWAPKTSKGWTHYQKSCKSTFASHDTWYNLLCNSKIDCPDPYSDCLKGRCQCPLVFKIWTVCLSRRYCVDWHTAGAIKSGVYTVELGHKGLRPVWCDMDTEFGGWMVIYRRRDGSVDFHRNWADYENGFGNISGDFWLGLDAIYDMTGTGYSRLRVELVATAGPLHLAYYDYFSVSGPEEDYKLYAGGYSGDAGDVFAASHGHPFHTYDHSKYGCATPYIGAWWYPPDCQIGFEPNANFKHLMSWPGIGYVAYAEMKMKPRWG